MSYLFEFVIEEEQSGQTTCRKFIISAEDMKEADILIRYFASRYHVGAQQGEDRLSWFNDKSRWTVKDIKIAEPVVYIGGCTSSE